MSLVKQELLFGISQVIFQFSVYELPIDIPTLKGVARFAHCPSLPNNTVLLGIDFGKEKFVELINSIKQVPGSVLSVIRAMCAEQELADQMSEALHQSEGANPLPLADIPVISELDVSDTADTE